MRQFAEERKLGTVELLYTYPLRDGEILGGKFLASVLIFLMMLGLTLLYPIFIYSIHSFALFPMFAGYLGLVLLGCSFIACGLFISSLCESQVIAGIATIVLLLFFVDSQLERSGIRIRHPRRAADAVDLRSIQRLRQRRHRTVLDHLLLVFHHLLHVPDAALDGGTQVDRQEVNAAPRRRGLWLNWITVIYTAMALAALFGIANLIIFDHNIRWDLTPNKRYSLSDFDKRVLDGLKQPVKVMAFVRTEDVSYLQLADLLFQVSAYTPLVTYQVIDVNKAPGLARQYGVSTYGEVIVESEGRRRDFDNSRSELAHSGAAADFPRLQQAYLLHRRSWRARPVRHRSDARLFAMARAARAEQLPDR